MMKIAIRTFALTLVLTGLFAGALSKKNAPTTQIIPASAPVPTCPLSQDGCGIW